MHPDEDQTRTDRYHQRKALLVQVIVLLSALLLLVLAGLVFGPGLDPETWQVLWVPLSSLTLAALTVAFAWLLVRRPAVLRIGPQGIDLPLVFKTPLAWSDIHRIRLSRSKSILLGRRAWLIVDPSQGVLAPLRLPIWRRLELAFQKRHGIRIPLHAIDAPPETVVASIQRFRPVLIEAP